MSEEMGHLVGVFPAALNRKSFGAGGFFLVSDALGDELECRDVFIFILQHVIDLFVEYFFGVVYGVDVPDETDVDDVPFILSERVRENIGFCFCDYGVEWIVVLPIFWSGRRDNLRDGNPAGDLFVFVFDRVDLNA